MLKFLITILLLISPTLVIAEWDVNIPVSSDNLTDFPVDNQENLDRLELVLREYPKGITISYTSATTVTASTGGIVCADSTGVTKKFRGNTSTTAITFSDLDTGAESSGTYYVYANCDAAATTATFKISASSTTPSGLTSYKRIGSFVNDGSNNITASSITNDSEYSGSTLGAWVSRSLTTSYQATTDGFFIGSVDGEDDYIFTVYSDTSSTPTTVRQTIGWGSSTTHSSISFSIPVKKGEYYRIVRSGSGDDGTLDYAFFIPMGG